MLLLLPLRLCFALHVDVVVKDEKKHFRLLASQFHGKTKQNNFVSAKKSNCASLFTNLDQRLANIIVELAAVSPNYHFGQKTLSSQIDLLCCDFLVLSWIEATKLRFVGRMEQGCT